MVDLKDCIERSVSGPICKEKDFDLKLAFKLRELSNDIEYNPDEVIPEDHTADLIFKAAVELLLNVGLYNKDTQRVITFTKEEIMEIAKTRMHEITLGTGHDTALVRERTPSSEFPPVIVTGPIGGPCTEEYFLPIQISYAQEATCQGLLGGVLLSYQGVENQAGRTNEAIVTRAEASMLNKAVAIAGKPGLYCVYPVSGITPEAIFNALIAEGFNRNRVQVPIQLMPELKLNWSKLTLAYFCNANGIHPWTDIVSAIGGYCRNPLESSISQIAGALGSFAFNHGSTAAMWSTTMDGLCTTKKNLWASCATSLALGRNVGNPVFLLGYASAGPGTEMVLYETLTYTIGYTISGGEFIWGGSSCNGVDVDRYAGLQGRMVGEAAYAVAGMDRGKANELINKLFELYEKDLPTAPKGKVFAECYDPQTIKPKEDYLNQYLQVKETMNKKYGIEWKY